MTPWETLGFDSLSVFVGGMSETDSLPARSTKLSFPFQLWVWECEMVGVAENLVMAWGSTSRPT